MHVSDHGPQETSTGRQTSLDLGAASHLLSRVDQPLLNRWDSFLLLYFLLDLRDLQGAHDHVNALVDANCVMGNSSWRKLYLEVGLNVQPLRVCTSH